MDNHGDILEKENKGRIQSAVENWEKSAKTPSNFDSNTSDNEPEEEIKDKIKKNILEINNSKERKSNIENSSTVTAVLSQPEGEEKEHNLSNNIEPVDDKPAYNIDYLNHGDFDLDDILSGQKELLSSLIFRFVGASVFTLLLLLITILPFLNIKPGFLSPKSNSSGFQLANLILLILVGILGYTVAFKGLVGFFKFKPDSDSIVSLSYFAALAGSGYSFYNTVTANGTAISVFSSCAAVCLCLNLLGKIFFVSRVRKNLPLIKSIQNSDGEFYAAQVVKPETAQKILKTFKGVPSIIKPLKVKNSSEFLEQSYAPTPADYVTRILSPIVLAAAIGTGAAEFFIKGDVSKAVMLFSAICCVASPLLLEASVAVPLYRASKRLVRKGAVVAGCDAVSEYGDADAMVTDASFIFPKNSVHICGVKTVAGHDINEAMLYAASITAEGESPIAPAIMSIFGSIDIKLLKKCEKVNYEDEKGLSAVIDGKSVLFGNRKMLRYHSIDVLSRDFEIKNASSGRHILYLAVNNEICAMFVVDYSLNDKSAAIIKKLKHFGIQLLVKSTDPIISPMLIEEKFDIPASNVEMLDSEGTQLLAGTDTEICHAGCIFKGIEGYAAAIISCIKLKGTINDCNALQLLFSIFGILLIIFSAFSGSGANAVNSISMLIYEAVCALPVLLIIIFRKQ